jgi:hypothetical protein
MWLNNKKKWHRDLSLMAKEPKGKKELGVVVMSSNLCWVTFYFSFYAATPYNVTYCYWYIYYGVEGVVGEFNFNKCVFSMPFCSTCVHRPSRKCIWWGFHPTRVTTPIAQSQTSHLTSLGHAQHASLISWPCIPSYVDLTILQVVFQLCPSHGNIGKLNVLFTKNIRRRG